MQNMTSIGIDLDGVVCNQIDLYKQIAKEEGVEQDIESSYNGIWKSYTSGGQNFGQVLFDKHGDRVIEDVEAYPNARKNYEKFITNDKMLVYIVTARDPKYKDQTKKWLDNNGFTHYEDLLFETNKLNAPVQCIIDDRPKTIESFVENARMGLIRDQSYNRNCNVGRRVSNLKDAYENHILPYL